MDRHHLKQHRLLEAEDGTGAIRIEFAKGTKDARIMSPEEVFAMILNHCKENGERHGSTRVSGLTITVPGFYSQARRQGVVDAVEISGLQLLGLVDENAAAAIQYAMDRTFNETATNIMFFNMGAGSTQVSIVQITGGKKTGKDFRNIRVIAKAWDESLGVEDIDLTLAALFAKQFDEKHPSADNKISDSARAMVRLKKEGRAIKEILSGLERFPVAFQALHRDVDFKSEVTRQQMEGLVTEMLDRVKSPVERALKYAGMTPKDLHLVEVIGGGFRVPGVRDALRKVLPQELELSTHVNSDEGMAFGAAFCAANFSSTFHVPRLVFLQDAVPREVRLILKGQDLDRDVPLFSRFSPIEGKEPTKQVIKFKHDKDFQVNLMEKKAIDDDPKDAPDEVVAKQFSITGFSGALQLFGKFGEPKVHLTFTMDRNMMLNLASAEAKWDEEYEEVVKPPKNSTSNKGKNATENATEATTETEKNETVTTVKKVRKHVSPLTVTVIEDLVPVKKMTNEAKRKAFLSIKEMDEADKERGRREEARNSLEAFGFTSRERISSNEEKVKQVMDKEESEKLESELRSIEDWIDDHKTANASEFDQERARLSGKVEKVFYLIRELEERPLAVAAFNSLLDTLVNRRANWTVERSWIPDTVWKVVDNATDSARTWILDMQDKQKQLSPKEDPVLSLAAIRSEMEKIQKIVELLLKQRKPVIKTATTSKAEGGSKNDTTSKTTEEKGEKEKSEKEKSESADTKKEEKEKAPDDKEEL